MARMILLIVLMLASAAGNVFLYRKGKSLQPLTDFGAFSFICLEAGGALTRAGEDAVCIPLPKRQETQT